MIRLDQITALDAGTAICFHFGRQRPGASEILRYA